MREKRYIDANELWREFDAAGLFDYGNPRHIAQQTVEEQHTADVVEVRHAHWIEDDREATCSDCKCVTFNWAAWSFDYCPFCGAKMDGKGEGE